MLNLVCMGFSMIDQELIDKNLNLIKALFEGRVEFEDSADELYQLLAETNDNYIKLIEQNAEIHKMNEKHKAQLKSLIECSDNNSGYEPSLSVFQREVDISKELLNIPL